MLDSLKCFVAEKRALLSTSTQILKTVCDPWHYFKVCCRSKSRLSHSIVGFFKLSTDKKKNSTVLLN